MNLKEIKKLTNLADKLLVENSNFFFYDNNKFLKADKNFFKKKRGIFVIVDVGLNESNEKYYGIFSIKDIPHIKNGFVYDIKSKKVLGAHGNISELKYSFQKYFNINF